jgi:predicted Zn-dependent protease
MLLDRSQAEDLARRVLTLSAADGCAVTLNGHEERNIRFASRGGATNGASGSATLAVMSRFGQREAQAFANAFDAATLRDTVARSEAAARSAPDNVEVMPALGALNYPASAAFFATTAALTAEGLADLVTPAARAARQAGVDIAAFTQTLHAWRSFATSGGAAGYDRSTSVRLTMTSRNRRGTWSGWAGTDQNDVTRLDAAAVAKSAIDKALAEPDPIALDPGKYVVLLEPPVVGQMVVTLMENFGAREADEGRSFLARKGGGNRLGELMFDPRVTIASDPADAAAPGFAVSHDGLPNRPVVWIDGGVVKNLTRGRYWGKKTAMEPIPQAGFYAMRGGDDAVADMIRDVKRGVLVTRLWYVRMVDPRSLLITGLTRDGTFLIEDGAVTGPVVNFRFNESPVAVLGNIVGVGRPQRAVIAEETTTLSVPPLLVKDFTFSSVSRAV